MSSSKRTGSPRKEPTRAAVSERLEIKPEDIDPHHDWSRLNAHGDERRFRGARRFSAASPLSLGTRPGRLSANSTLARCCASTTTTSATSPRPRSASGSRDKFAPFAVLTGNGEPHLWDSGRRAHHRIYAPWLQPICCHAGNVRPARTIPPDQGFGPARAQEIYDVLKEQGRYRHAFRYRCDRAPDAVRAAKARSHDRGRPAGHAGCA